MKVLSWNPAEKITDMPELVKHITGIFHLFIYLLIGTVLFTTLGLALLYNMKESKSIDELVSSTNNVLQSSLASQVEVLINNLDFISYIRSGDKTRKNNFDAFQVLLFSYVDSRLVQAIEISQIDNKLKVFETGMPSKLYITFELCYLNARFNTQFGQCSHTMTLFFNEKKYIDSLHALDTKISACISGVTQCTNLYPFVTKNKPQLFGNRFKIIAFSPHQLKLKFYSKKPYFWLILFLIFFIFLCLIVYLENIILRNIINKILIKPLQDITYKFKGNDKITIEDGAHYITEFKALIKVVLTAQQQAIEAGFVDIAKKITHNINSKVATLNAIISAKEIKKDQLLMAKTACVEIQERISTLLTVTKPVSSPQTTINLNNKISCWCLLDRLIQEVISQKQIEWMNNQIPCDIIFENSSQQYVWSYIKYDDIKDSLSNLLNNSYEATLIKISGTVNENLLQKGKFNDIQIIITLSVEQQIIRINIQDFGCGIPEDKITAVKHGMSLKPDGNGIGLSSSVKLLEAMGGKLEIISQEMKGTTVSLCIPLYISYPKWMTNCIKINHNQPIIIIDDSTLIHRQWIDKCTFLRIKSIHFTRVAEFQSWYNENLSKYNNLTIIMDYVLDSDINGLQLLQNNSIKNAYMVTSHAEDCWLQEIIEKTNYYLIPKSLIDQIELVEQLV